MPIRFGWCNCFVKTLSRKIQTGVVYKIISKKFKVTSRWYYTFHSFSQILLKIEDSQNEGVKAKSTCDISQRTLQTSFLRLKSTVQETIRVVQICSSKSKSKSLKVTYSTWETNIISFNIQKIKIVEMLTLKFFVIKEHLLFNIQNKVDCNFIDLKLLLSPYFEIHIYFFSIQI